MKFIGILVLFIFPFSSLCVDKEITLEERLNQLSPQQNVVVLQSRFLPRTVRFELSPAVAFFLSSEFFLNSGIGGSFGFNILEKHGFEFRGLYAVSMERQVLVSMDRKLQFKPLKSQDRTEGFFGLVYKWFPLYGKMAWWNRRIIPFETFLILGGGVSSVLCSSASEQIQTDSFFGNCMALSSNLSQKWEPTGIFGIGQSYSLSRNTAIRMDFTYQLYPFRIAEGGISRIDGINSDIVISFAFSMFFPERGLR